MMLTRVLLSEAETTFAVTERLFRRVSDGDLVWTPPTGGNWMTMGQLLMHCASFGCGKAIEGFVTGDFGAGCVDAAAEDHVPPAARLPAVKTVAEGLDLLAADRSLSLASIRRAGEADLLGRVVAAPWGGARMPLFQQILRMIDHLAQHKGQLFYYLKLMGKDVDTADLWGAPGGARESSAAS